MKKLELKFGGLKEMLTKEQMQQISGGAQCVYVVNADCGGGVGILYFGSGDSSYDQGYGDGWCAANNCCDDISC